MEIDGQVWQGWSESLQRWGVDQLAASLLETSGPLSILAAQIIYISQPLVSWIVSIDQINALAALLEEPAQARAFSTHLREAAR